MERVQLEVALREGTGKSVTRKLRAVGKVPAVLYGSSQQSRSLEVPSHALSRVLARGANQLIDLRGPKGVDGKLVLLKEYQRDPATLKLLHCDFYEVDTSRKIHVEVPLHLVGKPHGVEMGGVLEPVLRALEVSCLPLAIPQSIEVDVSALEIGHAIHVREIALPEGVELITEPSQTAVHVIVPRVVVEEAAAAAAAEPAAAPAEGAAEAPAEEG
jgi:large subunit ribosomal protein L25